MIIGIGNFALTARNMTHRGDFSPSKTFLVHGITMILSFIGSIGALVCAVLWLINHFKGA